MTLTDKQRLSMNARKTELYAKRHATFHHLLDENKIDLRTLAKQLEYRFILAQLQHYYDGTKPIVIESTYNRFIKAIDTLIQNKPSDDIITEIDVITLKRHGNVLLSKKYRKELDKVKSFVHTLGLDCRAIITSDGSLILEDRKVYHTQFARGKEK